MQIFVLYLYTENTFITFKKLIVLNTVVTACFLQPYQMLLKLYTEVEDTTNVSNSVDFTYIVHVQISACRETETIILYLYRGY